MKLVPKHTGWTPTIPSNTVLTLEEMKLLCYVDSVITEDDPLFTSMELSARNLCEQFLGRPLLTSTTDFYYSHKQVCDMIGNKTILNLPGGKLQTIDSITIFNEDGVGTVLTPADYYEASVTGTQHAQINFKQSPFLVSSSAYRALDTLKVSVTGGFGDTAVTVPTAIKQGMLFLVAYWYDHRDNQQIGNTITSSAKASWSPYKIHRFK